MPLMTMVFRAGASGAIGGGTGGAGGAALATTTGAWGAWGAGGADRAVSQPIAAKGSKAKRAAKARGSYMQADSESAGGRPANFAGRSDDHLAVTMTGVDSPLPLPGRMPPQPSGSMGSVQL